MWLIRVLYSWKDTAGIDNNPIRYFYLCNMNSLEKKLQTFYSAKIELIYTKYYIVFGWTTWRENLAYVAKKRSDQPVLCAVWSKLLVPALDIFGLSTIQGLPCNGWALWKERLCFLLEQILSSKNSPPFGQDLSKSFKSSVPLKNGCQNSHAYPFISIYLWSEITENANKWLFYRTNDIKPLASMCLNNKVSCQTFSVSKDSVFTYQGFILVFCEFCYDLHKNYQSPAIRCQC